MSLVRDLVEWDGKSASDIGDIYRRYSEGDAFVATLIELIQQVELQKAATWLLKHCLENGRSPAVKEVALLFKLLPTLEHWESKLHVLQCLAYLPVAESEKSSVELFLRNCLAQQNKLLRAWAYSGFYELSRQYPEYRDEAMKFFEMAMKDEAPSVKARVRQVMKRGY